MEKTYTADELKEIQSVAENLISYAERHDKHILPRCFGYLRTIVKNIEICKNEDFKSVCELSPLIQEDWKNAMSVHTGLSEYYIQRDNFEEQLALNQTIEEMIRHLNILIC